MKAKTIAYIKDGHVKLFMEEPASPMWEASELVLRHEAQAEIDALKAELAALKAPPKVLSAEEVKETGAYWWKKIGADDFDEPVQVFEDEHYITHDPILIISRIGCVGGISQECWKGQFVGPIQMPEVAK